MGKGFSDKAVECNMKTGKRQKAIFRFLFFTIGYKPADEQAAPDK